MIDWTNLIMNALWILGCALVLATLSCASWAASAAGEKFGRQIKQPGFQITLNFGGLFFCVGLAGTSSPIWQRVLWLLLALGFAIQIGVAFYQAKSSRE